MVKSTPGRAAPTLSGWILRDSGITAAVAAGLFVLHGWQPASAHWLAAVLVCIAGFIGAYVLCYIYHEWGHLIGARAAGVNMPLAPYRGALLGYFDNTANTASAFLALSWGGVLGYLTMTGIWLILYATGPDTLLLSAATVGALAFTVQSLSVDMPQIYRVSRGADHTGVNSAGTTPALILQRTRQSWLVLSVAILLWTYV